MGPDDVNDYITAEVIRDLEPHEPNSDDEWTQGLTQWWLLGSELSDNLGPQGPKAMIMANVYEMMELEGKLPFGVDIVELCGGESRVSTPCYSSQVLCW